MAFEYLPHTADIKFRVIAETLEEAFSDAAKAVTHVMTDDEVKSVHEIPIDLESESLDSLFFDYLDEIIGILDTHGIFVHKTKVDIEEIDGRHKLFGSVFGDEIHKYDHHGDVKAPTYHSLSVKQTDDGWELIAVLDI